MVLVREKKMKVKKKEIRMEEYKVCFGLKILFVLVFVHNFINTTLFLFVSYLILSSSSYIQGSFG